MNFDSIRDAQLTQYLNGLDRDEDKPRFDDRGWDLDHPDYQHIEQLHDETGDLFEWPWNTGFEEDPPYLVTECACEIYHQKNGLFCVKTLKGDKHNFRTKEQVINWFKDID